MKELLRKKSVRISILLIILLVVMGIVGINVRSAQRSKEYDDHITAAEKYLSELDYEQAIAEYTIAFEIDPKEEVVDALEQTYLAYAQTYVDMGDYDKAVSILEEGYAKTGRESIQTKSAEYQVIQEEMRAKEAEIQEQKRLEEEQRRLEEERRASGMVEFPFQMTDITVMGYDLFGDHFAQLEELIRAEGEVLWQTSSSTTIRIFNDRRCDITTTLVTPPGEIVPTIIFRHICVDTMYRDDWFYHIDDGRNGSYAILSFAMSCEARHGLGFTEINVPIKTGETYEDWCRVMQIDQIKENNLRPEERNGIVGFWIEDVCVLDVSGYAEVDFEGWRFSTEQYQGVYIEVNAEDGNRTCVLRFYNPGGYGAGEEGFFQYIYAGVNADGIIVNNGYAGYIGQ